MSAVLRSVDGRSLPVLDTLVRQVPSPNPEAPLNAEIARLNERIAALEYEVAGHPAAIEEAQRQGVADGREAAVADYAAAQSESLAALRQGVDDAVAVFAGRMAALDELAAVLASECLAAMFGDPGERGRQLADAIRHQVKRLGSSAILKVSLSSHDIGDDTALTALADELGYPALHLARDHGLGRGECRMQLRLGEVDVGIDSQFARLRAALHALAGGAA